MGMVFTVKQIPSSWPLSTSWALFLCLPLLLPKCDGMVIYCERDTFEQELVYCSQCDEP